MQILSKKECKEILLANGLAMPSYMLGDSVKTAKGLSKGYLTGILYLKPDLTICPSSKIANCLNDCLVNSGFSQIHKSVNIARENRTKIYKQFPNVFYSLIHHDITRLKAKAAKLNLNFCVRLNGTSDINHLHFISQYSEIQFYDYTKRLKIVESFETYKRQGLLDNYHLTFSYSRASEVYERHSLLASDMGYNLAVVFKGQTLPKTWLGKTVINGDETDLRFLDTNNSIVGLTVKGHSKNLDNTFFVDPNIIAMRV